MTNDRFKLNKRRLFFTFQVTKLYTSLLQALLMFNRSTSSWKTGQNFRRKVHSDPLNLVISPLVMDGLKIITMSLLCSYIFLPMHVLLPLIESTGIAVRPQCVQLGLHMQLGNRRGGETRLAEELGARKERNRTLAIGSIVCRKGAWGITGNILMWGWCCRTECKQW